ncbi:zinc ribbon domain-containing protein [Methanocella arvoryzae]|nr:zinc ribbon domain-containing protein [Methanocella arvoryzae]
MVDLSFISQIFRCGTCIIIPVLFIMLIITLIQPKYGTFFLKDVDNKLRKRNGVLIWTGAIILFSIINGFSIGTSGMGDSSASPVFLGIVDAIVYLIISLFLIGFILVVYVIGVFVFKMLTSKPINNSVVIEKANAKSDAKPINQPKKPVYNVNNLLRQLIYGEQQAKVNAAYLLKDVNQPLLQNILHACVVEYNKYQNSINNYNNQIRLSPYGSASWVIGYEIGQSISNNAMKSAILNNERRWKSALNGAQIYIYHSCESVDAGLLELTNLMYTGSAEIVEQGQYVVKSWGVSLVEPLIKQYDNPHAEIRYGTILLLAALDDIRSYDPIRRGLQDSSQNVRDISAIVIKQLNIPLNQPIQKEVIKEIVKIPCKYCGTYIENTATFCPSCGAPLGK